MKLADVIPVFKKKEWSIKENYGPVSILPIFSKIFEKILHDQISTYFTNILITYLKINVVSVKFIAPNILW